ncbi:purine-nucleoside phosphorylase [Alkalithermobacter thermoalcaliphilus JW-YL-7 = DSM 7308]|uniref:Purine nucleoside phosphorylase n=1 Tax=Alkalithermobacter thermoalcaliphilus JW-YL-7 = DSM 7308 TaxID=1121328 RepID=A0A150FPX9_CLOPD|nr:purine nucleoside phosphorylase I, inosine and guanosine-specific [[Clostridium] paradoxum JW-YL-7 = DSM 7308]SHK65491.1 purine-nucleoside phosphorylase [[Clostridium] paradoxum JW-YL-7 = DSM 7308]
MNTTQIKQAVDYIESKIDVKPEIGLILGSGLGVLADEIEDAKVIKYEEIPNFPVSTVEGHEGQLVIGKLEGKNVIAMQGRFHYYEGYTMKEVTFPVRVMKSLGVDTLIVTNACGGLNPNFYAGALMIINDHINFTGANPLIGPNDSQLGVRFPDMSTAYDKELIKLAKDVANKLNIEIFEGVYAGISGPNYFSKAELNMLIVFGADTIGMSTVPEVIVARHSGMRVLGISCITDMAIPNEHLEVLTHEQVVKVAQRTRPKFISLVKEIVKEV